MRPMTKEEYLAHMGEARISRETRTSEDAYEQMERMMAGERRTPLETCPDCGPVEGPCSLRSCALEAFGTGSGDMDGDEEVVRALTDYVKKEREGGGTYRVRVVNKGMAAPREAAEEIVEAMNSYASNLAREERLEEVPQDADGDGEDDEEWVKARAELEALRRQRSVLRLQLVVAVVLFIIALTMGGCSGAVSAPEAPVENTNPADGWKNKAGVVVEVKVSTMIWGVRVPLMNTSCVAGALPPVAACGYEVSDTVRQGVEDE